MSWFAIYEVVALALSCFLVGYAMGVRWCTRMIREETRKKEEGQ